MSNIVWIIVDNGQIFEGTVEHWKDCFFSNPSVKEIEEFCSNQGWSVKFLEDVPVEFRSRYNRDELMVLPVEKYVD